MSLWNNPACEDDVFCRHEADVYFCEHQEGIELALQEILCCLGDPVGGKPHQYVMEKAFAAAKLDCRYATFEVIQENVADALKGLASLGFQGAQVEAPLCGIVSNLLEHLTRRAQQANCVDLIYRDEKGNLTGDATQGIALVSELRRWGELTGHRAVVFGHDAPMSAVVAAFIEAGIGHIGIVSVGPMSAQQMLLPDVPSRLEILSIDDFPRLEVACQTCEILVNGIDQKESGAHLHWDNLCECLPPPTKVADISLNPNTPFLINCARSGGRDYIDGLTWMVERYRLAFKRWTAIEPDKRLMREALEEFLMV